jgi:hypothetical protein
VTFEIDCEWIEHTHYRPIQPKEGKTALKRLKKLKKSSQRYHADLESLDTLTLMGLRFSAWCLNWRPNTLTRDEMREDVKMAVAFAKVCSAASDLMKSEPPPRKAVGRPAGGPFLKAGYGSLARFTLLLLWDVRAAGGSLTLDKNARKGTLIDALNLLRPHLPPGFFQSGLSVSMLAAAKRLANKYAGARQEIGQ